MPDGTPPGRPLAADALQLLQRMSIRSALLGNADAPPQPAAPETAATAEPPGADMPAEAAEAVSPEEPDIVDELELSVAGSEGEGATLADASGPSEFDDTGAEAVEALDEFVEAAPEAGPAAESEIAAQSAEDGDAADMFVASVTIGEPDESEAAQAEPSPEGEETNNPFLSAASEIDTAGLPDAGVEANSEAMEEESPSGAAAAFFGQVPASDEPSTEAADQSDEDSAPISGGSAVDSIEVVDATPTEVVPEDVLAPHEVAPERLESRPPAAILPDDVLAPHESPVAEAAQMEAEPARSELAVLGISQDEVPASDLTETQPSAGDTPLGEARTDSLEPEAADPDVPSLQARGNVKVEVLEGDRQGAKFLGKSTLLGATGAHCLLDGFDLPVGTKVKFSLIAPRFSDQIDIYDAIVLVASGDSGKVDVQLAFSTRHDDVDKFVARHFGGKAGFSLFGRFRR